MTATASPWALKQSHRNENPDSSRGLHLPVLCPPPNPVAPLAFSPLRLPAGFPQAWLAAHPLTPASPPDSCFEVPLAEGLPGPPGPTTTLGPTSCSFVITLTSVVVTVMCELIYPMSVSPSTEASGGQELVLFLSKSLACGGFSAY